MVPGKCGERRLKPTPSTVYRGRLQGDTARTIGMAGTAPLSGRGMGPLASQKQDLEGPSPSRAPRLPGYGRRPLSTALKRTPCHLCPEPALLCPGPWHQFPHWPRAHVSPSGLPSIPPPVVFSGVCRRKPMHCGGLRGPPRASVSGLLSLTTSAPLPAAGASADPHFPLLPPFRTPLPRPSSGDLLGSVSRCLPVHSGDLHPGGLHARPTQRPRA